MRIGDRATQITLLANEIAECAAIIFSETKQSSAQELVTQSKMLISVVKRRDEAFDDRELFYQPCWEMLLQIFSSHLLSEVISVSKICEDSYLPISTARRWLQILEHKGYITMVDRDAEPLSAGIQLTDRAISVLSSVITEEHVA
jgi:DNA-binding MarR family transcriptional regulator